MIAANVGVTLELLRSNWCLFCCCVTNTPGEVLREKLGRGVRPAFQNPYPIMTKIYDFPYPIYDLTKNLIPYYLITQLP